MTILESILDWFGFYESPKKHPPSPRTDKHIGSEEKRYDTAQNPAMRRSAIEAGVNEEKERLLKEGLDEKTALQKAIDTKRRRLILIRTLQRNKKEKCKIFNSDVWWMYQYYELDKSGLTFECN